jgi:hypothetical protein
VPMRKSELIGNPRGKSVLARPHLSCTGESCLSQQRMVVWHQRK